MKLVANDYTPAEICKILREWTDLNREEFGKSIHRTARSIRSLETGERYISLQTLLEIAKVYGIKIIIEKK